MQAATSTHAYKVHVGRGALVQLAATLIQVAAGMGLSVVVSRRLGFDDFGIYSLGLGAVLFLSILSRLGMDVSVVRWTAAVADQADSRRAAATVWAALGVSAALGLMAAALLWFVASFAGDALHQQRLTGVLRSFSASIPLLNVLYVSSGVLRARHRAVASSFLSMVLYPVGRAGFAASVVAVTIDLNAVVLATVGAAAVAAIAALLFVRAHYAPTWVGHGPVVELIRFGSLQTAVVSAHNGLQWADLLLIAAFLPVQATGLYRIGAQSALLFTVLLAAFGLLFGPLARHLLVEGEQERLDELAKGLARMSLVATGAAAAVLLIEPSLLLFIFGPNAEPARPVYRAIGAALVATAALGPYPNVLTMGGHIRLEFAATSLGLLLAVLGGIVLIPAIGVVGGAVATASGILLRSVLQLLFTHRRARITPLSSRWVRGLFVLAALVSIGVLAPVPGSVAGIIAGATFMAWASFFVLTQADRDALRTMIGRPPRPEAVARTPAWVDHDAFKLGEPRQ